MKLHPSLTPERVLDACRRETFGTDNPGFCVHCGEEAEGCEPDARRRRCDACDRFTVFGAEELLLHF